jgi:hypothetical protein
MAGTKANTPEETEAALEELGPDCIRIYADGGGPDEHGDTAGGARTRCECTRTTGWRYWRTSRAPS